MEDIIKEALKCNGVRKMEGGGGGGCISEGQSYVLDEKKTVFVKKNNHENVIKIELLYNIVLIL